MQQCEELQLAGTSLKNGVRSVCWRLRRRNVARLTLLFVGTFLAVAGWCEATFDTSQGQAQASFDAMKAGLTDAEEAELDAAVRVIDTAISSILLEVQILDRTDSAVVKLTKMFLHGKTAAEFVASAHRACGVFHPNEFMVQMACEKLREAEDDDVRQHSDPRREERGTPPATLEDAQTGVREAPGELEVLRDSDE